MKCEDSEIWQQAMEVAVRVHGALGETAEPDGAPDVLAEEVFGTATKLTARIAQAHDSEDDEALDLLYEARGLVARLEAGITMCQELHRMELVNDLLFECKLLFDAVNEEIQAKGGSVRRERDEHED